MKLWITSDTHYAHGNIIEYCDRPFHDTWEMNANLSMKWNYKVSDEDIVLHLGDVTLLKDEVRNPDATNIIKSLKGRKVLITGNHDHHRMLPVYRSWGWNVVRKIVAGDVLLVHAPPVQVPEGIGLVLHGHTHGKFKRDGFIDVGVDATPGYDVNDLRALVSPERYDVIVGEVMKLIGGCQ